MKSLNVAYISEWFFDRSLEYVKTTLNFDIRKQHFYGGGYLKMNVGGKKHLRNFKVYHKFQGVSQIGENIERFWNKDVYAIPTECNTKDVIIYFTLQKAAWKSTESCIKTFYR